MTNESAAKAVFAIPELLELILLALPFDKFYEEIESIRFILRSQTVCRNWRRSILNSTPVRQALYLPTLCDAEEANIWLEKTAFPPARPNPWTPHILLNRRSWGSAYPFDNTYSAYNLHPSRPKLWTFSLEISRPDYERFPEDINSSWRKMLVAGPPFACMWCTRAFYELGSGRAPFVTYLDYVPNVRKQDQKYVTKRSNGITLGDLVAAVSELFTIDSSTKWVRVESVRENNTVDNMPVTVDLLPPGKAQLWSEHFEPS